MTRKSKCGPLSAMLPRLSLMATLWILGICPGNLYATWYEESVEKGSDIIMMDLRWPWWPSSTYYANWNAGFSPPSKVTFYAGFVGGVPDTPDSRPNFNVTNQSALRPNTVWTFWGSNKDGAPVCFVASSPWCFISNAYGGEGGSAGLAGLPCPLVTKGQWYTMLARVWQPAGVANASYSYVGRWIKDVAGGKWHLIGIARLPVTATSFNGNSGFIEPLGGGRKSVKPLHRRFGYCRKDGSWLKSDTISIDKTRFVVVNTVQEGDHEYAAIEYSHAPDLIPQDLAGKPLDGNLRHSFKVKQPDRPTLDLPAVEKAAAEYNGRQVKVSWSVPETASPAFAYKIELFENPECQGAAKVVKEERMPTACTALLDAMMESPTVRLTVTDVFDQSAKAVVIQAIKSDPIAPAVTGITTIPGLEYELLHQDKQRKLTYFYDPVHQPNESHYWVSLDEMKNGQIVQTGISHGFDLGLCERTWGYAMNFKGYLRVPADGLYLLHAQIDGGYRIKVDGRETLTRDGQQGTTEKTATLNLAKGDHSLAIEYFVDQLPKTNFKLDWEGIGMERQEIPLQSLRFVDDGRYPQAKMVQKAGTNGTAEISVSVDARGHVVEKTILFLGKLQIAEAKGSTLEYNGPVLRGDNTLWTRIVYDKNRAVDSPRVTLKVVGKPVDSSWTVRNVGEARSSYGLWQTSSDAFAFFGEGLHIATKMCKGDFTATCRIDSYNGSKGEPVNHSAWVGLSAREYGDRLSWTWGEFFHLVQTAARGLYASPDHSDLGGWHLGSYCLPKDRPWIRIVRTGNVWTAWTSIDGKQWELGAYQLKKMNEELDVGLFVSALPQEANAYYQAAVSHLSVQPGLSSDLTMPVPATARNTAGDRLTGVVVARSDANVVVVRSSASGLLRSTDGGKTWVPANGSLEGDDLIVRSVAIHPNNPLVMLRACGRGSRGNALWMTTDGGKSWKRLNFDGNFDGAGPSALCGEVVAFDIQSPEKLYVGCESKGLFRSTDNGATWIKVGAQGERITSVVQWPWLEYYPGVQGSHICIITCPDKWMAFLGRGEPGATTPANRTISYMSVNGMESLSKSCERDDTGLYNVAFERGQSGPHQMCYASTHGFQNALGAQMFLSSNIKNHEWLRPVTALGATATGEEPGNKTGYFVTQAIDPLVPGRLTCSRSWAESWNWMPLGGDVPKGGLVSICGEHRNGKLWWLLFTDGLYSSKDEGKTLKKILDPYGRKQ